MLKNITLLFLAGTTSFLLGQEKADTAAGPAKSGEVVTRIAEAGKVFSEIMAAPDKAIPQEILERAHCVGIVPGMKRAGFIVGGRYGKGVLTCRTNGSWSGPSTIRIEGGSFGAQIGGGETDVVLVVMNERGAERLMGNEFTFGGDAAAMAGPVGREAAAKTDALMSAQILSYSRSRGLFAGVTLNGSTLRSDDDDNAKLYGRKVSHKEILMGKVPRPPAAAPLYASLKQHMPPAASEASREKK
jgi:lipid-binding SYLF domain-containing protein